MCEHKATFIHYNFPLNSFFNVLWEELGVGKNIKRIFLENQHKIKIVNKLFSITITI